MIIYYKFTYIRLFIIDYLKKVIVNKLILKKIQNHFNFFFIIFNLIY